MHLFIIALLCGQIWTPDQRLTNDTFASFTANYGNGRQITAAGSAVNLGWFDYRFGGNGDEEVFGTRSTDNGATWSAEQMISATDIRWSYLHSFAGSGDSLIVAWVDYRGTGGQFEIFYRVSSDGGATWQPVDTASVSNTTPQNVAVALDGATIHVAWQGFLDTQLASWIIYRRSTDFGATWSDTLDLRPLNPNQEYRSCGSPALAFAGDDVYCAWYDRRRPTRNGAHWLRRSSDRGATWQAEARVTTDSARLEDYTSIATLGTVSPSVVARESVVIVAWADYRAGNWEVYLRRSVDHGATWQSEVRATNAADTSCFPNLARNGNDVHLLFSDKRDGNCEVYHKRSTDLGATWGPDTRLTDAAGRSSRPSAAVTDSAVHVVWSDERDGNWEVYYKRGDLVGLGAEEQKAPSATRDTPGATVARGELWLAPASSLKPQAASLLDISGRRALALQAGPNDISRLSPGVYFIRDWGAAGAHQRAVRKIVIQ